MSFDTSRFTFNPRKNYSGVVMEQGRVQLDSDWNEWLAQLSRRTQAGTLDTFGAAASPATTPDAFEITIATDGSNAISIGPGRMYVDGLQAENHGDPTTAVWDPALAELSNAPQPPAAPASGPAKGAIDFLKQPWLSSAKLPVDLAASYLAYLDVWQRAITYVEDPNLIDPAVGIDTTGRLQTVWQVKLAPVEAGTTCANAGSPWPAHSSGQLTTGTTPSAPSGPCCLTTNTGYTGLENQNYRVEIHNPGPIGKATFKWSRDNASVETNVTGILSVTNSVGVTASQLTVVSMGRDQVLGFAPGNWIELLDDDLELLGLPGELHLIDTIDFSAHTITLDAPASATSFPVDGQNQTAANRHTRIRRWDQAGKILESDGVTVFADLGAAGSTGDIPVPPAGTTLILESGITVAFGLSSATGVFNTGDFWTFSARTADGSVQQLTSAPPRGIHHHYARLSVVTFSPPGATDCRIPWASCSCEGSCGCCTVTVGDGVESVGKYTSINDALAALPASGGEVCILPGRYYEHVLIQGKHDVVLRGCGYHTRIASPSLKPGNAPANAPGNDPAAPKAAAPAGTFNAVISLDTSQHIQLLSFAVEADTDEVGILIDGTGKLIPPPPSVIEVRGKLKKAAPIVAARADYLIGAVDITVEDTFLSASTLPVLLAKSVRLLRVDENRVAMANVFSLWPAVWVSGQEIHIDRNWVGIQSGATLREWFPTTVVEDLFADSASKTSTKSSAEIDISDYLVNIARHPGGIQIAGPSRKVYVNENIIEGGRFNGITLGSYTILDANGDDTGTTVGITTTPEDPCSTTGTLQTPTETGSTNPGGTIVADGLLIDIWIDRNRISGMGLCGIGPIGFFDLLKTLEMIFIENLTITANTINDTLLRPFTAFNAFGTTSSLSSVNSVSAMPYGVICAPSVENLVIRDNAITNFGAQPGIRANGIFVLNGEMVEISRNQILETRDWNADPSEAQSASAALHGGIILEIVTPPALSTPAKTGSFFQLLFEPGLPALRIEENVVRVPLGQALVALGFGPFAISNNHFTCGGTILGRGTPIAQTVLILNLGTAIEAAAASKPSDAYKDKLGSYSSFNQTGANEGFASSSNGTVLFTNNICQLEARVDRQHSFTSVAILTPDHLTFSNNHCWIDSTAIEVFVDALLLGGTINVTSNRFQESKASVFLSGWTFGGLNITSQNISTFCLLVEGGTVLNNNNLALIDSFQQGFCDKLLHQ